MISPLAIVETENIGKDVSIQEFTIIRPDVVIGDNVIIHGDFSRCGHREGAQGCRGIITRTVL